jgi:hypothetical protein
MGLMLFAETSVRNYHSTLHKIAEYRRSEYSSLERSVADFCIWKYSLFIVRTVWNINSVCGKSVEILVLNLVITNFYTRYVEVSGLFLSFLLCRAPHFQRHYIIVNSKRFWRWCIILCGDGFMDFIHRPKSKVLKILKIKITTFRKLALLPSSGEWRGKDGSRASFRNVVILIFIFLIFYASDDE